ncbi:14298_t:CDS:10, partial [Dentiscutata heterogama]
RYLSSDSDRSKPHNYLLYGVIVHSGDLHRGSYYVFIKPEKNGKWFKFDDNIIIPVTDKEVLEKNYGAEVPNAIGSKNAYMLIYIRESDIDFVLSPIFAKEIPNHLKSRLDKEKALCEHKKKKAEKRHLYLYIKIVTLASFESYQGFDLANFGNKQYPLSKIPHYKILKNEKYKNIKAWAAKHFGHKTEQIRLWVLLNRQNQTVRPETLLTDDFLDMTMEQVHTKVAARPNELKLFLEVVKPINGKLWFPPIENGFHTLVFIKYFNPDTQCLEGLCHLYVHKSGEVGDIIPILCEKKKFPPHTSLKIYEEIKQNMIQEMNPTQTFQQLGIQDGDIICFQKALNEKETQEHTAAGRIHDIPTFYESLYMRIIIQFKPKYKNQEQYPEFELVLNKKYTYDDVAKYVAAHLSTDPLKLRFTTAKKTVIERTTTQILSEMLQTTHQPRSVELLYYEMLDINIVELESKKFFKVHWLGTIVKEEEVIDISLPKTAMVNEIIKIIINKLALRPTSRIRLYDALHCKIQKEYDINDPINMIQENTTLYAEEIPQEEINLDTNDKVIQDEPFYTTILRLKLRLGINEKDFSKVKGAIVQAQLHAKPQYIDDNVILSDYGLTEELLGLDHLVFHKLEIA